jgi:hypothetical protein
MALVLKDRVKETTTTTGTGSFSLAGAVTGYDSFGQIGSGNTTYYAVYLDGGSEWEVGIGTYTSPSTLSRDTILASSNSGSVVTFSAGQKTIWCDYPAGKAAYQDANGVINNTTFSASTKFVSPHFDALNSAGGQLRNASGTPQLQWGSGGGNNVSIDVAINLNPPNSQVSLAPTGTGTVVINPATAGNINNMTIGATTPKDASFVNLSVTGTTSFDGQEGTAGQVLTSAGSGNTPTWTTPTTGTVTSVGGTGSVNGITLTGTVTSSGNLTLGGTLGSIANNQLTNSSITVNGTSISLGGSGTITAANPNALTIGTGLTGTSYNGSSAVTIAIDSTVVVTSGSYSNPSWITSLDGSKITGNLDGGSF